jgi:hypothetical protein
MKITSVLTIASTLMFATLCPASDRHEADEGLEKSLRAAINERHVHLEVHRGIVTLEGRVRSEADRQRIEALIRENPGVVAVKDELKVEYPSPGTPEVRSAIPVTPEVRSSIPVYATPPPEVSPPVTVVAPPAPVIIPEYPKLKVQAWTLDDQAMANRIAQQLQADRVPMAAPGNVTVKVRNGTISLHGVVAAREERDAIIESVQRVGGVTAIYDQLQVR